MNFKNEITALYERAVIEKKKEEEEGFECINRKKKNIYI